MEATIVAVLVYDRYFNGQCEADRRGCLDAAPVTVLLEEKVAKLRYTLSRVVPASFVVLSVVLSCLK